VSHERSSPVSKAEPIRSIVHLDLDAFFAAVEVLQRPALAHVPLVVGGRPGERGVVAAASYPARKYGVRSAMPMGQAVRLCPDLLILPARHRLYREYSQRVMSLLREEAPLVEQMSIDEAYLEFTDLVTTWEGVISRAAALQQRVKSEIGLSASLGVATSKLIAKIASDRDKPGGLTVVRPGEEAAFLAPLPVSVLWGVGPVTTAKLNEMGVITVGDLAQVPEYELTSHFGSHGTSMARQAKGIDRRPLAVHRQRKSIGQERTFARDIAEKDLLLDRLAQLCENVARHLDSRDLVAGAVVLKLRYGDFTTLTRQTTLAVPTQEADVIRRAAVSLLLQTWQPGRAVRLLGISARKLAAPSGQLMLWEI
jgi:DNA polymerase-4